MSPPADSSLVESGLGAAVGDFLNTPERLGQTYSERVLNLSQTQNILDSLDGSRPVYLIGIGGCGMSGLAHLLLDAGFSVAGSDLAESIETEQLAGRGASIFLGHRAEQISKIAPSLVCYSSAISPANVERQEAINAALPLVRRSILLSAFVSRYRGICVAGMHGKTTTSALLSYALRQLGYPTGYAVGALLPQMDQHAMLPKGQADSAAWFVAETDESDGSLRHFSPEHALILNLEEEHLDYFANLEAIQSEFAEFARRASGLVLYCADDAYLPKLIGPLPNAISFGWSDRADYQIKNRSAALASGQSLGQRFDLFYRGVCLGHFDISLLGEKNASNAAGVIAFLHQIGRTPAQIAGAISGFRGAARRQFPLVDQGQVRVYEDYGHHPTEIAATIAAFRELAPSRLVVAFQPHRFTRTQHLFKDFAGCFHGADLLWLTEVYAASEPEINGVNGRALANAIRASGQNVEYVQSFGEMLAGIKTCLRPGDLVLFLGAGDITLAAHALAVELTAKNEQQPAMPAPKVPPAYPEIFLTKLQEALGPNSVLRRDELMAKRTTLRVGGPADFFVEPHDEVALAGVLKCCAQFDVPWMVLGRGSNLLVKDGGIRGLVIHLSQPAFSRIELQGSQLLCHAGARLKAVANAAREHGLSGLEFLEGIPGTVGGALRMNAGAMGTAAFEVVNRVRYMESEGRIVECAGRELHPEYRHCAGLNKAVALSALLSGRAAAKEQIEAVMAASNRKRWESQPAAPSAGCIFKNTLTTPAGKLVDELGLKGARRGRAIVSDVHANFIVTEPGATARDVLDLIKFIQSQAREKRGLMLETEVQIVGEEA